MKKNNVLIPESVSIFTPEEFSRIKKADNNKIESVTIRPPKFGRRDFGRLVVKWKYPRLRKHILETT